MWRRATHHAHNCRIDGGLHMLANKNDGKSRSFPRFRLRIADGALIFTAISNAVGRFCVKIPGGKTCPLKGLRVSENKQWSFSLNARDVFVGGDVLFQASRFAPLLFRVTSCIGSSGARIGGALSCRHAFLPKELTCNNADIETNVYLGQKSDIGKRQYVFRSNEAVTLRNTRIKGRFECANATLKHQPRLTEPAGCRFIPRKQRSGKKLAGASGDRSSVDRAPASTIVEKEEGGLLNPSAWRWTPAN